MFKFKFSLGQGKIVCWALVVLLFSALAVSNLQAQVNTAVLSGTATDATGAVVAGAKIQAKNVGTGISYVRHYRRSRGATRSQKCRSAPTTFRRRKPVSRKWCKPGSC